MSVPAAHASAHWLAFASHAPLAILADLDGTLIPFAATVDAAAPGPELHALLTELAASPGVTVAIVSGRAREKLDPYFPSPELILVAEHGGWRRDAGEWQLAVDASQEEVQGLTDVLRRIASLFAGAYVERKTWSVAFHLRGIREQERDAAAVAAENRIGAWLAGHPRFEELRGSEVFEVRPARMDKSSAIVWLRTRAGAGAHILALGDDLTDEDAFRALGPGDESVLVGERGRATAAHWSLETPAEATAFLRWVLSVRRLTTVAAAGALPTAPADSAAAAVALPRSLEDATAAPEGQPARYGLLVVSNRLPELRSAADSFDTRKRNVGGLVAALEPALRARRGVWLGWSGRTLPETDTTRLGLDDTENPRLAWMDFPEAWHQRYYNGLCNGALWPLLHCFPDRARFAEEDWEAYRQANEAFAAAAVRLVGPGDMVWVHDYHLFLLADRLRRRGHTGPIGLFLHIPFPGPDLFFLFPWAEELLTALLSLDLIGFHTPGYAENFRHCAATLPGVRIDDGSIEYRGRRVRVGAFPIGIIPGDFQEPPSPAATEDVASLMRAIAPTRLVLGVDRLDYTKGIPERLAAFARMLELYPEWRRKVSLVQVSVPSRGDVPAYAEQRERVEQIVGRTNGDHGDPDWVPIRYLYRSFGRGHLSLLYRSASIGYITPLRDGMNLVAKEYVAAQDPADPGVLVLSRFAGAAVELGAAVLTNPWHVDGLARDLDRALRMGLEERRARHAELHAAVARTTALTWAEDFLSALGGAAA